METTGDSLLALLHDEGYSVGTYGLLWPGGRASHQVIASKDGHRWQAMGPDRYQAVVEAPTIHPTQKKSIERNY